MNNYILYVYTTSGRKNYAKEQNKILKNIEYYFVYNNSTDSKIEPFLNFNDKEAYENISLKTFNCFNHFLSTTKEFFIKINDDCALDTLKLEKNFNEFKDFDVIGGFIANNYNNCSNFDLFKAKYIHSFKLKNINMKPKKVLNISYPEGSFYILSRKAVDKILSKFKKSDFSQNLDEFVGEDMTIGGFLNHFKSELKFLDIKVNTDLIMDITKDFISTHPLKSIFLKKFINIEDNKKMEFLKNINFSNEYLEKEEYLKRIYNEYSKQS